MLGMDDVETVRGVDEPQPVLGGGGLRRVHVHARGAIGGHEPMGLKLVDPLHLAHLCLGVHRIVVSKVDEDHVPLLCMDVGRRDVPRHVLIALLDVLGGLRLNTLLGPARVDTVKVDPGAAFQPFKNDQERGVPRGGVGAVQGKEHQAIVIPPI